MARVLGGVHEALYQRVCRDPSLPVRMLLDSKRRHEPTSIGTTWAGYAVATYESAALIAVSSPHLRRVTTEPEGRGITLLALAAISHPTIARHLADQDPALLREPISLRAGERGGDAESRDGPGRHLANGADEGRAETPGHEDEPPTILERLVSKTRHPLFRGHPGVFAYTPGHPLFQAHPEFLRDTNRQGEPLAFALIGPRRPLASHRARQFTEHLLPTDPGLAHLENREGRKLVEVLVSLDPVRTPAYIIGQRDLWPLTGKGGHSMLYLAWERLFATEHEEAPLRTFLESGAFELIQESLGHPPREGDPRTILTALVEADALLGFDRLFGGRIPGRVRHIFLQEDGRGQSALALLLRDPEVQRLILGSRAFRWLEVGGRTLLERLLESGELPLGLHARAWLLHALGRFSGRGARMATPSGAET